MLSYYVFVLTFLSLATAEKFAFPCQTPSIKPSFCISIFECPTLQRILGSAKSSAIDTIKKSICRNWTFRDLMVCCPQTSISSNNQFESTVTVSTTATTVANKTQKEKDGQKNFVSNKLIPSRKFCGLQHTDDRFYNETETALDEYPWLVHVLFGDENDTSPDPLEYADRCSGVLINNRYVLTNGFCAGRNPFKVRLGQYNTNESISCVDNPNFEECTEPAVEIRIEEIIHKTDDEYPWYDFALLRLAENVIYNDFIRPICLPIRKAGEPDELKALTVSGWGADDQTAVLKKRISYNLTNNQECYKLEEELPQFSRNASLICLNPPENNTNLACTGDEGGPLMYSYKHQWFVDAIIVKVYQDVEKESFCTNNNPVDGIRITPNVIDWVVKTVRV